MIRLVTRSVEETRRLGEALAQLARPGDLVLLSGDLGAGKTALAQGFGRGAGVAQTLTSPTFVLVRTYEGRYRVHHVDVYRLDRLQEAIDLGLPELVDDEAVTLVEWGDVVAPALPSDYLTVRIEFGEGDDERVIEIGRVGPRWSPREDALGTVTASWQEE